MNDPELTGQPAEVKFTLSITRAATGLTEEVEMVGHTVAPEPITTETQEQQL